VVDQTLSDAQVVAELARLARCERHATVELLRWLGEFDARKLYLSEGSPSLFAYCTQVLNYGAHAALNRIEVARAARQFPQLLDEIAEGAIHLSGARVLAPHLTAENCEAVLAAARYRSKREIEDLVVALAPQSELPAERFRLQFMITRETRHKLRQVQNLMFHQIPDGDVGEIFDRALTLLLEHLERTKLGATSKPREAPPLSEGSRRIPSAVRRVVWDRDGGRCAFVGRAGRCRAENGLQFHHVVPFAAGGEATPDNIELRCWAHNRFEADLYFGAFAGTGVEQPAPEVPVAPP